MKKICCALALIVTLCAGHTAGAITATLYKETDYGRIIPETRITTAGTNKTESVFSNRGAFIIAKAVKLGRGNAYSVAADANLNTGTNDTQLRKGECESNEECPSDKKCMGYKCVDVCTQPTGQPGMSLARICGGKKCIADPNTPHSFMCVDGCYNVVCKSGYTTEESSKGCCCEEDTPTCSAAQVYHPTLKKCVAAVCPANCADMCSKGYCTSCKSGYTLGSDGMCKQIAITCPANCSTCSSSSTCTKCSSGYYLSSGKCVSCPLNATCSGTSSFTCKTGYEKYNNTCRISSCNGSSSTPTWCQDGYTRVEGKGCCPAGVDPNRVGACLQCAVREPALAVDCGNCNCGAGYTVVRNGMTCSCEWDGVTFPAKASKVCF